jgi:hypothetical protein
LLEDRGKVEGNIRVALRQRNDHHGKRVAEGEGPALIDGATSGAVQTHNIIPESGLFGERRGGSGDGAFLAGNWY